MDTLAINKLANSVIAGETRIGGDKKSLRKGEIDGLAGAVARLKSKSNLSPEEQSQLKLLEAKLLDLRALDLTAQALETPVPVGITAAASGPGPTGKTP